MQEKIPESRLVIRYNEYKEKDENKERRQVLDYLEGRLLKIEITNRDGHNQIQIKKLLTTKLNITIKHNSIINP